MQAGVNRSQRGSFAQSATLVKSDIGLLAASASRCSAAFTSARASSNVKAILLGGVQCILYKTV